MAAKVEVRTGTTHPLELGGDPRPYHTGKRTSANKKIRLRNFAATSIRLCFRSRDSRPISAYFESPVNIDPSNDKIGWVELAPPASGQPFRQYHVVLNHDAWGPPDSSGRPTAKQIKISANLLSSQTCDFPPSPSLAHVQDIIIDAG